MTRPLAAQSFGDVGTRAQGMGLAFVAVSDDATATWWNPAGLAGGPLATAMVEYGQIREPADPLVADPATRNSTLGFAVAFPAMGLSYYQLRLNAVGAEHSIGVAEPGRQDPGTEGRLVRSIAISAFGATIGQSIGGHLVVASTIRVMRAGSLEASAVSGSDPLDQAGDLSVPRDTKTDLDVGVMFKLGGLKAGGAVKHLAEPEFGDGTNRVVLQRQARVGVSATRGKTGVLDSLIGAVDVDVTSTPAMSGESRQLALGGELGLLRSRLALRGGLNASTVGEKRWSQSAGASIAVRSGLYVDGAVTPGSGESRNGWSVSLRSSF